MEFMAFDLLKNDNKREELQKELVIANEISPEDEAELVAKFFTNLMSKK